MRSLRPQRAEGYRTRAVRLGLEISTRELSPARAPGLLLTFIEASHITSGPLAAARASRRGLAAYRLVENFAQSTDMEGSPGVGAPGRGLFMRLRAMVDPRSTGVTAAGEERPEGVGRSAEISGVR